MTMISNSSFAYQMMVLASELSRSSKDIDENIYQTVIENMGFMHTGDKKDVMKQYREGMINVTKYINSKSAWTGGC